MSAAQSTKPIIDYPDSDGERMSDSTLQFDWIALLKWNAEAYFRKEPLVFVAGDHLIYAVEGSSDIRCAPDVYVAFGRPKGERGSYKLWEEEHVFPQVIFEVWSESNGHTLTQEKFEFYERYGAEEYYVIYPQFPAFVSGWRRERNRLIPIPEMSGFISPHLGFRFELTRGDVRIYGPDNRELQSPTEIADERDEERQRADAEKQRADKLAAKLRELGVDPDTL